MILPDFEYFAPENLQETCALLTRFGAQARVIFGGTDVLAQMKKGQLAPEVLVSLNNLKELTNIYYQRGKGIIIGAGATHNDIVNSPLLQEKYLSVCEAAHKIGNHQIRNIGTIGGNIVNALPSADLPPILIALGANVKFAGTAGERTLPLEKCFMGPGKSIINPDEILTEVIIPDGAFTGSTYFKFSLRRSGALAVVGVAVAVIMEGDICLAARIVLGAAAPTPIRAVQAEQMIKNQAVTKELLEEAGRCAAAESKTRSSIRGSAEYRRDMVRVLTRRALARAVKEGHV